MRWRQHVLQMNILGIDTALEACSVGLSTGDPASSIIRSEIIGRGHAEQLFGMIQAAMADADLRFDAIGRFAVTIGPGSFTGIRVGIAAARGFALVTGAPTAGFSTLAVHAETAQLKAEGRPILAALPAKSDKVYAQLFSSAGDELTEPAVGSAADFAGLAADRGAILAGSGATAIAESSPETPLKIAHEQSAPHMAGLLRLAFRGEAPTEPPRPLYIKAPGAVAAPAAIARR